LVQLPLAQKLAIDSGSGSRNERRRRSVLLQNLRRVLETTCTQTHASNIAVKWTRKRLFNSILTRIERVDFSMRVIYAG
jgi:hypothetical protein